MSRKRAKGILYPVLLVLAWAVMGYSVLFGGFSTGATLRLSPAAFGDAGGCAVSRH